MSRVAQSVQCLATDWTTGRWGFDPRQRRKDFSSSLCVQTDSGAHPASCTMGIEGPFPDAKERPGREPDHSPPSSAEVENEWELYLLSPQAPSWRVVGQFKLIIFKIQVCVAKIVIWVTVKRVKKHCL
jgi:hypothetical protein